MQACCSISFNGSLDAKSGRAPLENERCSVIVKTKNN